MRTIKIIYFFILITLCYSCDDPYENTTFQVYDVNPVASYLDTRSDEFSSWIEVLKVADLFNAINQATENFTVFVPTNEAVEAFCKKKGVSSIDELGQEYILDLAKYHIIGDSINLNEFVQGGKLEDRTLSDDYLSVTFDEESAEAGGFNSLYVNNEAHVKEVAIKVSNGYVYVLNSVLSPLVENLYERVSESETGAGEKTFSIFKTLLEQTSWSDSLSVIYEEIKQPNGSVLKRKRDYTLLAVSDAVFKQEGISSITDLANKIGVEGTDYKNKENGLFLYAAYHIIEGNYSLFDFRSFDGTAKKKLWNTKAEAVLEVSLQEDQEIYLNYEGKINEQSVKSKFLDKKSDVQAKNGMLHELDAFLPLWESITPVQVEWDFCDYSEVASYIATYGTTGQIYQTEHASSEYRTEITDLSCYTVDVKSSATPYKDYNPVDYFTVKATSDWTKCKNKDQLTLNIGMTGSISMKSPIIIAGKYKVVMKVCYAKSMDFMRTQTSGSNGGSMQFTFDDDSETTTLVPLYANVSSNTLGVYDTVIYDEIEFDKTGVHTLKMVVMDPSAATNSKFRIQLDYMLFEPIIEE